MSLLEHIALDGIRKNKQGVHYLLREVIEELAEGFVRVLDPTALQRPQPTPLAVLADRLQSEGVKYDGAAELGSDDEGIKVLGQCQLTPPGVFVDRSLSDASSFAFTFGHEVGHLLLHRKLTILKRDYKFSDRERDLVTGAKKLKTPRDWLEWQANRFSSALIMPAATFHKALQTTQEHLDVHRNFGIVYVGDDQCSRELFSETLSLLAATYGVTGRNVEIRLDQLGCLRDRRHGETRHISQLLREGEPSR